MSATTDRTSQQAQHNALLDSLGRQYSQLDRMHSVGVIRAADRIAERLGVDNERCAEVLDQSRKPNPEMIIDWDDPVLRKANEVMPDEIVDVVMLLEEMWKAVRHCIDSIALCLGWEREPCCTMLASFENVVADLSDHAKRYQVELALEEVGPPQLKAN